MNPFHVRIRQSMGINTENAGNEVTSALHAAAEYKSLKKSGSAAVYSLPEYFQKGDRCFSIFSSAFRFMSTIDSSTKTIPAVFVMPASSPNRKIPITEATTTSTDAMTGTPDKSSITDSPE